MDYIAQKTISKPVLFRGIGVHTGEKSEIIIKPADPNSGITFIKDGVEIPANVEYVGECINSTCLIKDGVIVRTIEHLMAAFHGLGIDNVEILIRKGEEIPILDGSAKCFGDKILKVGLKELDEPRLAVVLKSPVEVRENDNRYLLANPGGNNLKVEYYIDYGGILKGKLSYTHAPTNFFGVYDAKTFVFKHDLEVLKTYGAGRGIRIGKNTLLVNSLTDPKDCLKHKILDLLGDLYLLGHPIFGELYVHRGGHSLHSKFVRSIYKNWKVVKLREVCGGKGHGH